MTLFSYLFLFVWGGRTGGKKKRFGAGLAGFDFDFLFLHRSCLVIFFFRSFSFLQVVAMIGGGCIIP